MRVLLPEVFTVSLGRHAEGGHGVQAVFGCLLSLPWLLLPAHECPPLRQWAFTLSQA